MFILFLQTDVSVQSPWYNLPVPHLELWGWLNNNVKYSGNEDTPGMFAFVLPQFIGSYFELDYKDSFCFLAQYETGCFHFTTNRSH